MEIVLYSRICNILIATCLKNSLVKRIVPFIPTTIYCIDFCSMARNGPCSKIADQFFFYKTLKVLFWHIIQTRWQICFLFVFFFTKFYASSYSSKVINQDIFRRSWAQIPASLFASNFLAVETDSGSGWIREASLNSTRVYYIRIHANNLGKGMDPSLALLVK